MEKEINKLKKIYLDIEASSLLKKDGLSDLWKRVDEKPISQHFYFPRIIVTVIMLLFAFVGFFGAAQAAQPGNSLYPVKIATQKIIANITHKTPEEVKQEIEKIIPVSNRSVTPTPNMNSKEKNDLEEDKNETKEEENKEESSTQIENNRSEERIEKNNEEIKGISTERREPEAAERTESNNEKDQKKEESHRKED